MKPTDTIVPAERGWFVLELGESDESTGNEPKYMLYRFPVVAWSIVPVVQEDLYGARYTFPTVRPIVPFYDIGTIDYMLTDPDGRIYDIDGSSYDEPGAIREMVDRLTRRLDRLLKAGAI